MKKIYVGVIGILSMILLGLLLNFIFSNPTDSTEPTVEQMVSEERAISDEKEVEEEKETAEIENEPTEEPETEEPTIEQEPEEAAVGQPETEQEEVATERVEPIQEAANEETHGSNSSVTETEDESQPTEDSDVADMEEAEETDEPAVEEPEPSEPVEEAEVAEVSIIIDARQNGGTQYVGEVAYHSGDTALDSLLRFTQYRGLSVQLGEADGRTIIQNIDGHQVSDIDGRWVLYINGYQAPHEAGANKIVPNSLLRFHYETINE